MKEYLLSIFAISAWFFIVMGADITAAEPATIVAIIAVVGTATVPIPINTILPRLNAAISCQCQNEMRCHTLLIHLPPTVPAPTVIFSDVVIARLPKGHTRSSNLDSASSNSFVIAVPTDSSSLPSPDDFFFFFRLNKPPRFFFFFFVTSVVVDVDDTRDFASSSSCDESSPIVHSMSVCYDRFMFTFVYLYCYWCGIGMFVLLL